MPGNDEASEQTRCLRLILPPGFSFGQNASALQSDENCTRLAGSGSCVYVEPEVAHASACPAGCAYEDKSPTPARRCQSLVQGLNDNCPVTCRKDYATAVEGQQACLALPEGKCGSILKGYSCVPDPTGGFLDTFDTPFSGTCAVIVGGTNANCAGATTDADCTTASTAGSATGANACVFTAEWQSTAPVGGRNWCDASPVVWRFSMILLTLPRSPIQI